MGVLIMGPEHVALLLELRQYAETHERGHDEAMAGPPGELYRLELPIGFLVVFTIDQATSAGRPNARFWVRNLSISVATPGRIPHPSAALEIMVHLGFSGGLAACQVTTEAIGPRHEAIHIVQALDPAAAG